MERKNSRRFTKNNRQKEEVQHSDDQQQKQQSLGSDEIRTDHADRVIADMAQGFIEAQAKMTDRNGSINNFEIALLLEKVNNQLEEMKKTTQSTQETSVSTTNQQSSKEVSAKDLQALLKSVLRGEDGNKSNTGNEKDNKQNNEQSSKAQSNDSNEGTNQQNVITAQTASQVLAQAQYELANELESSLKKLKQVISESEKLANNITTLLGEKS